MSKSNYLQLRSRQIPKDSIFEIEPGTSQPFDTSTPTRNQPPSIEQLRESVQQSTHFLRELSNQVDKNISVQHCTTLIPQSENSSRLYNMNHQTYNKELADLMATNIPKFELNTSTNPALQLRSFIKSCENVLNLFPCEENEEVTDEFFKLIWFRLGYDVQERITMDKFESLEDLECHLRSICYLKLNKGRLLNEIRHERQQHNEDVSHFVERLRKLIAQGRSEYAKDKDFEREAIHTLKNCVKNELISIKLMDSTSNKFEELAEIAINRDLELHQRNYNTKPETNISQEMLNDLIQKIKTLETNQTAKVQNIRQEPLKRNFLKNTNASQKMDSFCNYCKRVGHFTNDCRTKRRDYQQRFNQSQGSNTRYGNQAPLRNFRNNNSFHNQNRNFSQARQVYNSHERSYNPRNTYSQPMNTLPRNYNSQGMPTQSYQTQHPSFRNLGPDNVICVRCNQPGHKSNNCYEIICRNCKQLGHSNSQCQQNSSHRRVHFLDQAQEINPSSQEIFSGNE